VTSLTLFEKLWTSHVVADLGDNLVLLHIDRHFLHDLNGMKALVELRERGHPVSHPELTIATADHALSTVPGRSEESNAAAVTMLHGLREEAARAGIRYFGIDRSEQGIVHVMGPEQGLSQPGASIVCGDSHTCTQGALGALAFGIGRSEVVHVLASQTLYQKKPKRMRVRFEGALAPEVAPKDLVLHLIGRVGAAGGSGYAIEYAGSTIRSMSMEGRMTVCNLSIELGAKFGLVAPDETTFSYLAGRPFSPRADLWDRALEYWRSLTSDDEALFDREITIDSREVGPQITWGTSPQQVLSVDGRIPDPAQESDPDKRSAMLEALTYMGLSPGQALEGLPVDWVFIGSCTNGRIEDLRAAAQVLGDRKVAPGVQAWVVPGSQQVQQQAEAEGLGKTFRAAGFQWREPGCSMCLAANGETVPRGKRSVSTTNRNFEGRQGPQARTHLASPAMAAAAALTGHITDIRKLVS
jgi:3-isopropylmalate/(R)-2-methylmalate dehydratase large subunit